MLRIESIKLPPEAGVAELIGQAARILRVREKDILSLRVVRRSVDAREDVRLVYTAEAAVADEAAVLRRCRSRHVSRAVPGPVYTPPEVRPAPELPPVVAGAGPAGLFAALVLALAGQRPILLERGRPVEQRAADVERFWSTGELDLTSNVQFGEGGAGAFSDGKLNTGTKDLRHRFILETLVSCGAPEDILIDAKPHVGTDYLHIALVDLRRRLLELGADIRFGSRLTDLDIRGGALAGITVDGPDGPYPLPCRQLVLCPGHSARTPLRCSAPGAWPWRPSPLPWACGSSTGSPTATPPVPAVRRTPGTARLHLQALLPSAKRPGGLLLLRLPRRAGGGRRLRGGAGGHQRHERIRPGPGEHQRRLLVNVTPEDYGGAADPLAGIAFQRKLESAAYALGGGGYRAPAQRVGDFLAGRPSAGPGRVTPSYRPGVTWTDLRRCLPDFVADTIRDALPLLGQKLRGYDHPDAVLTAVESRSSSPVRIPRDETYQSSLRGLYPCGEGAGYAGGILSAAADGMRCAERLIQGKERDPL